MHCDMSHDYHNLYRNRFLLYAIEVFLHTTGNCISLLKVKNVTNNNAIYHGAAAQGCDQQLLVQFVFMRQWPLKLFHIFLSHNGLQCTCTHAKHQFSVLQGRFLLAAIGVVHLLIPCYH